jgi:hypothetical protein
MFEARLNNPKQDKAAHHNHCPNEQITHKLEIQDIQ